MNAVVKSVVVFAFALFALLAGVRSCTPIGTYNVKTFEFIHSKPISEADGPAPSIWIDTNTKLSSLFGGSLTSSLPCSVMIDYTDNSSTFKAVVFTTVKITYDDGTVDPSTDAVQLPLRIAAREYESVNSVAGGRIVKSKDWILSGKIPNVITRAEPFTLQLEGHFTKDDGSTLPFAIDQHFDLKTETAVKSAAEVLQDK